MMSEGNHPATDKMEPQMSSHAAFFTASIIVRSPFGRGGEGRAVASDGAVRVYDEIAGYWTTCHSLTAGQCARVRKLATV
jgi:hypothetical protein